MRYRQSVFLYLIPIMYFIITKYEQSKPTPKLLTVTLPILGKPTLSVPEYHVMQCHRLRQCEVAALISNLFERFQ